MPSWVTDECTGNLFGMHTHSQSTDDGAYVFSGVLDPALDYRYLFRARRHSDNIAAIGAVFTARFLTYPPEMRAGFGAMLRWLFPRGVYPATEVSRRLLPHAGLPDKEVRYYEPLREVFYLSATAHVGLDLADREKFEDCAREFIDGAIEETYVDGAVNVESYVHQLREVVFVGVGIEALTGPKFLEQNGSALDNVIEQYRKEPVSISPEPMAPRTNDDKQRDMVTNMLSIADSVSARMAPILAVTDALGPTKEDTKVDEMTQKKNDVVHVAGRTTDPALLRMDAPASTDRSPRTINVGDIFDPATHYTEHYYDGRGIRYQAPDGQWQLYHGTGLSWDGYELVIDGLELALPREAFFATFDNGCSSGDFVRRLRRRGYIAHGFDISQDAINRSHLDVRPFLQQGASLREVYPDTEGATLLTMWDVWEHIPIDDVDGLVKEVAGFVTKDGYAAFNICTIGRGERDWTIRPGDPFTLENSSLLVSGHCTMRTWAWWAKKFAEFGLIFQGGPSYVFQVNRAETELVKALSWSPRHFGIFKKVG